MELCTWAPHVIENVDNSDLSLYLEFACTACIAGGPCTTDKALHVLYQSNGDIKLALETLLKVNPDQTVEQDKTSSWNKEEVNQFEKLIIHHGKNFSQISRDLKSKSPYQCIEFYYLWKHSSLRNIPHISPRSHRQSRQHHNQLKEQLQQASHANQLNGFNLQLDSNNNRFDGQSQSTLSQQAGSRESSERSMASSNSDEQFPCKVCGRVFLKIKSRSAHMKRHKNER